MGYILRRLGYSGLVIVAVSIATFALIEAAPGEFFDDLRQDPRVTPETIEALRQQYGFTEPPVRRYLQWAAAAARGEFGYSLAYQTGVADLLWARARNTIVIAVPAMLLAWGLALLAGAWCAVRRGGAFDRVSAVVSSALLTLPEPVIALLFLVVALNTGWFPVGGMSALPGTADLTLAEWAADLAAHAALPVCALALIVCPLLFRHVRAALIEVADAFPLCAVRGHGIHPARVLWRHALPMAANPLMSLAGLSVGLLLSTSLLVEVVMGWPGLGPLLLEAILARDRYVVVGAAMLSAVFLVAGNLIADLGLFAIDPRIRTR